LIMPYLYGWPANITGRRQTLLMPIIVKPINLRPRLPCGPVLQGRRTCRYAAVAADRSEGEGCASWESTPRPPRPGFPLPRSVTTIAAATLAITAGTAPAALPHPAGHRFARPGIVAAARRRDRPGGVLARRSEPHGPRARHDRTTAWPADPVMWSFSTSVRRPGSGTAQPARRRPQRSPRPATAPSIALRSRSGTAPCSRQAYQPGSGSTCQTWTGWQCGSPRLTCGVVPCPCIRGLPSWRRPELITQCYPVSGPACGRIDLAQLIAVLACPAAVRISPGPGHSASLSRASPMRRPGPASART
jgi:hypothetical protein